MRLKFFSKKKSELKDSNVGKVQSKEANHTVSTINGVSSIADQRSEPNSSAEYFESALEKATFGKFNYLLIFIAGLILANVLLETLGISYVLPVSQCDLNLSIQERSILSVISFAGIISSSHLWGFLADTRGRKNVICPTLLLGFLATVLSSFAAKFWLLVILRYINGFFISAGSATIYAYLGEFHTNKNRARAIFGSAIIFSFGSALMPALAWLIINQEWQFYIPVLDITYKPWRLLIVACGIPGFICGLTLFKIPESPKFVLAQGDEAKCLEILQRIYHINTGKPISDYKVKHVIEDLDSMLSPSSKSGENSSNQIMAFFQSMWDQTQFLFNREYVRTTMLICCIQFGIFTTYGVYYWFPDIVNSVGEFMHEHPGNRTYMCHVVYEKQRSIFQKLEMVSQNADEQCNEKLDISTYQHSLILEVFYLVGFSLIGAVIDRAGKMNVLFVCLAICGTCAIVTVYIDIPMVSVYLYLIVLLFGLAVNVLSAITVDLYPTKLRAMAVCLSLMMGRLGGVVGANVVGILISDNCETAFVATGVTLIISGLMGFLIPKRTMSKNNLDIT